MALTINIPDTLRKSVEAASNGRNTVLYTAKGQPCYMSILAHTDMATANAALGISRHPAFIVNGVDKSELFIGQHLGSSSNAEMVSVPGADPVNTITFDNAILLARANGNGWHVMSNAEWSAVALYCYYNGFQPRGNTNFGRSSDVTTERGVTSSTANATLSPIGRLAPTTGNNTNRTYTGSGPASWRHDNTPFGIADLCGNVWEWQSGIRILNGQIQVQANNDAALATADFAASSTAWQAIDGATGALVAPASSGTVRYANANSGTADFTLYRANGSSFEGMANSTGANPVSAAALTVLKSLGLFPIANAGLGGDVFFISMTVEALPVRGGSWTNSANAGVVALNCGYPRSGADGNVGARPAFVL
jgi:hypothetical protein